MQAAVLIRLKQAWATVQLLAESGDYAVVKLAGNASNYNVTVNNGYAIVTDQTTSRTTDISKIQYVQLDSGKALVFARDSVEASISTPLPYRFWTGR